MLCVYYLVVLILFYYTKNTFLIFEKTLEKNQNKTCACFHNMVNQSHVIRNWVGESYKTIPLLMSSQRIFSVHYVILWFISTNCNAIKK